MNNLKLKMTPVNMFLHLRWQINLGDLSCFALLSKTKKSCESKNESKIDKNKRMKKKKKLDCLIMHLRSSNEFKLHPKGKTKKTKIPRKM